MTQDEINKLDEFASWLESVHGRLRLEEGKGKQLRVGVWIAYCSARSACDFARALSKEAS